MEKKGGEADVYLDDFKSVTRGGYFIYTNAGESGGPYGLYAKPEDFQGVDFALIDANFCFLDGAASPERGMYAMEREEYERLKYFPAKTAKRDLGQNAGRLKIKTRISFIGLRETSVYDVINCLLESGYDVVAPKINGAHIIKWIHLTPADGGYHANELITN